MTAEIAVMNEEAIALAADSAVTGPSKIFTSANKIFALSKYHPVALMVFDNARFHGVPWETIVKQYRRELGDTSFKSLQEHAEDFINYFNSATALFPPEAQDQGVAILVYRLFTAIREDAFKAVKATWLSKGEKPSGEEVVEIFETMIGRHHHRWKEAKRRTDLPKNYQDKVRRKYAELATAYLGAVFENIPLSERAKRQLKALLPLIAVKDERFMRLPTHSGIVIAGFGDADVFPCLRRYNFECIIAGHLKYVEGEPADVGADERGVIIPFAQREPVDTFMEGIAPSIRQHLLDWWLPKLNELVGEVADQVGLPEDQNAALVESFEARCFEIVQTEHQDSLMKFSDENKVRKIIGVVGTLPKDELAEMAESLVNLTSFERRVTPEAETVGGPIDVAVISRGDGFIWIKRKHYFSTELNPHFLKNYYRD
jgi:hypothetical protein